MTTKPKAPKFRIRRSSAQTTAPVEPQQPASRSTDLPSETEDGFGDAAFPGSAKAEAAKQNEAGIAEIRREGLTGRQLRMARRLAQKHGLNPSSDFDAVRQLRGMGIDPFDRANMLELVKGRETPAPETDPVQAKPKDQSAPEQRIKLPQTVETDKNLPGAPAPSTGPALHEIERIQRDIARRRRRKLIFLGARLGFFVLLPTLIAFFYFAFIATPSYATKSEFIVQQAEAAAAQPGLLGGTAMATSQDSILVQDFLTSREALQRLDADHGYREHFSEPSVDSLQRIPEDASNEAVYKHFQNHVKIGYDPTEGVIRMEVSALTPEKSQTFSEALIGYAEERVDQVTERKREDQMRGARETFSEAETKMVDAQQKVLELQEQLGILDPVSETAGIMTQVNTFETQLAEKRLQLNQLLDNERPNAARVAGVEGDIDRLQSLIGQLRSQMTEGSGSGSLASVTARLSMAEVDLETRTMMMQESLQQLEVARVEANRQVRFLSLGVSPIPPDVPTYPRVFENTLIAFLIFGAIYLLTSVTVGILREQVSS
ncbi:MAG: capsule biosynthesis protein [Silicimonas sp.]|nr:capsule biosynthesis protein [Silicimonas sp.]